MPQRDATPLAPHEDAGAADLLGRAMDASVLGMALLSPDGRFVRVNHALTELLRLDKPTLLDRRWQDLATTEHALEYERQADRMRAGILASMRVRDRYVRPNGQTLWLDAAISPIRDAEGTLLSFMVQLVDVTESVRVQDRYRLLAENGTDVVATGNNDGVLEWLSPSVEGLLGWRPGEMAGTFFLDYVHPDDRPLVQPVQERVAAGEPSRFEVRLKTRDGGYRWISALVKPIFDDSGKIIGRIGGWRDFETEAGIRKALLASEHRYRMLAENASDVVYTAGLDRMITWVSPTVHRALGWQPEDIVGHALTEFLHPDDVAATAADRAILYSGAHLPMPPEGYLTRIRARTGEYHWIRSFSTTMHDEDGNATAIVVGLTIVDKLIEARDRAEATAARLAISEQRFRLLAENASDVVLHTQDLIVQWVSPSLTDALGWLPSEWVGHSVREFIHPDDHALVVATREQAMRGERVVARTRIQERSGAYLWVEAHLAGYREPDGRITGVVVSLRSLGAPVQQSRPDTPALD